jgi:glycosyltransferase involved in cell wall biosynthesis
VPVVATYHGIYSARTAPKRWYNAVMTRGDIVIANSNFTRRHVLTQHATASDKVVVIPEGVDTSVFDPVAVSSERVAAVRAQWGLRPDDGRRVILVAARLTAWKGHRILIEALARMAARESVILVFAGPGESSPYANGLRAAAVAPGLADSVRLPGPCDDMPAACLAADIIVSPSVEAESFGRTVAEAGAMGRPVIVSDLGGAPEIIVDGVTGWLTSAGDAGALARTLETALNLPPDDRAAMGATARARIESRFSLSAMCEATFALYDRLCEDVRI